MYIYGRARARARTHTRTHARTHARTHIDLTPQNHTMVTHGQEGLNLLIRRNRNGSQSTCKAIRYVFHNYCYRIAQDVLSTATISDLLGVLV
jgi:hypothetical protein